MLNSSVMSDSLWPCGLVTHQAPLSMGIPRQECWSGLPCPPPGDLPSPGIEPRSPALQADSLPAEPPGKPIFTWIRQAFLVAHGILSCSRWDLLPWSGVALKTRYFRTLSLGPWTREAPSLNLPFSYVFLSCFH